MTIKLPSNVLAFAAGDTDLLNIMEAYKDYWNQYRSENGTKKFSYLTADVKTNQPISFAQKEEALSSAMLRWIGKRAGVDFATERIESLITHPLVKHFAINLTSMLIDCVLPDSIIQSTSAYAEVKEVPVGQTAIFDLKPRDLFPVSKAGRLGMRESELKKAFPGQAVLNPVYRQVSVSCSYLRLLTGQESLADFTIKEIGRAHV
jgi:hypothetical protein